MSFYKSISNRWQKLSLAEQLANIGSEISRVIRWKEKDEKIYKNSILRALELFDLTLEDSRWRKRLREIARARELFCDAISEGKEYNTTLKDLEDYFFHFAFLARKDKN